MCSLGMLPVFSYVVAVVRVVVRSLIKDGDLTTSWTYTGDPQEPNDRGVIYYECELSFRLVGNRNIKQVKIGEAAGAKLS